MNLIKGATRMVSFDKPTGQGFPNWQPPEFLLNSLKQRQETGNHQYTRAYGHLPLVNSISKLYSPIFKRSIDPLSEICVSNGGVSVLCAAFMSLVDPNDEVILLDPSYDCYRAQITMAGGISRSVPLRPKKINTKEEFLKRTDFTSFTEDDAWLIDWDLLEKTLNEKTKIIVINTPHNPTGKVFTLAEMERLAEILKKFPRVIIVEDGVYQHITFNVKPFQLPRFAQLSGMWERTVSVYSAGQLFSATGTRIGWAIGPNTIIKNLNAFQQYNSFCLYGPMQESIADSLDVAVENGYFNELRDKYEDLKGVLLKQLLDSKLNLNLWVPEGGYFVLADISKETIMDQYLQDEKTGETYTQDYAYCIQLAKQKGVVAIPCSVFYGPEYQHIGENLIRFAFCKVKQDILEAGKRLSN